MCSERMSTCVDIFETLMQHKPENRNKDCNASQQWTVKNKWSEAVLWCENQHTRLHRLHGSALLNLPQNLPQSGNCVPGPRRGFIIFKYKPCSLALSSHPDSLGSSYSTSSLVHCVDMFICMAMLQKQSSNWCGWKIKSNFFFSLLYGVNFSFFWKICFYTKARRQQLPWKSRDELPKQRLLKCCCCVCVCVAQF